MQKLRSLRQAYNLTQQQLAERMNTTQQTIARWESGKVEPSVSALRDLAMIFMTSVDDLLGQNPISAKISTNMIHYLDNSVDVDGFWGHLGLFLNGEKYTRWFPITMSVATEIRRFLTNLETDAEWLCIPTLNNRMLAVNPLKLRRIWLLDDACDEPNDWQWNDTEEYSGLPLEFYRGLSTYFLGDKDELAETTSERFRAEIEQYVSDHQLDEEKIYRLLHETIVYSSDGVKTEYRADTDWLHAFCTEIELRVPPKVLYLPASGGDFESFFPLSSLAAVDMPLLDVMDAAKDGLLEVEGE